MGYQEQLARVRRWLERLESSSSHPSELNNPFPADKREEYEDFMYAFFQNCWHLKDWILADSNTPEGLREAVKKLEKRGAESPLTLCAGLANGSKHLGKTRDSKLRAKTVGKFELDIDPDGNSQLTYKFEVIADSGNCYEALELARQALNDWEKVIKDNGGVV